MRKIILLQFLLFSVTVFCQPPLRFFTKFGGYGVDIGYSVKPTKDRQYIVTGSTSSYGAGNTDMYLVKVDSFGVVIWQKTFGGFTNDVGKSVVQLPDSGYVVAGFTNSFGAGGYDVYLVRTDKAGNLIWQKTFGGTDWDFANDVVLTPDGDIAVVGNTSSYGHGKKDGLFLKFDYSGNLVQQKFIGGVENEELRSIIVTNDLFLASVGYTESKGDLNGDCYFAKLDLNGDTIFTKTFGAAGKDYANDIVLKPNTDFVICGAKTYTSNPKTESLIYSLNATGGFLWENHYYASSTDEAFVSLANSYQPSIPVLTANLRSVPVPSFKMDGNIFLTVIFGYYYKANSFVGPEDEILYSIEGTSDGGYVCTGSTLSFGSIGEDVFMIKLDSTVITYSNVVGVKENSKIQKPTILYEDDLNLAIEFLNAEIPYAIEICDLHGKKIKEYKNVETNLKINIIELDPSMYILRFRYNNGNIYNAKIIRK
jgi:hypothetical protein